MNWKYFLIGVSTGLAGAYLVKEAASRKQTVSPEDVLEKVKSAFKEEGPISGSWINMNAEPYSQPPLKSNVYKGGISRNIDGESMLYEFIADSSTGTVIKTHLIN